MTGTPRKALPPHVVDLIRDGVDGPELRARGNRAVWSAVVRTAASAMQHGHTYPDWAGELSRRTSHLGTQIRLKRGKETNPAATEKRLRAAWSAAERWVAQSPAPHTADGARAHARLVRAVLVADPDAPLSDTERAVLSAACDIAERNGTTRPALPRRGVAEVAGIGEKAARLGLDALADRGILRQASAGRRGAPGDGRARAALYRLPADPHAYLSRVPRPMGPNAQTYGPLPGQPIGPSAQTYGPPGSITQPNGDDMPNRAVDDALTAARQAVEALGVAVLAQAIAEKSEDGDAARDATVIPLRRAAGDGR